MIEIRRDIDMPVYLQIASQLASAIQRGRLPAGSKLPGTRTMSALLAVHRNTVSAVYEELEAQGWVDVRVNRGTFVALQLPRVEASAVIHHYPDATGFTFRSSALFDNPFEPVRGDYTFSDGVPDIRLTQIDDLSRLYSANMKRKINHRKMSYQHQDGSPYFKEQLCRYLHLSRSLNISTENILITRSIEMSLFIISELLLNPGDEVVVGTLSYFPANMVFQKAGAKICTIPVDENGLNIDYLHDICKRHTIRMVYINPQRHYPTIVSLSAERRMQLLELAKRYGFVIVEDDQDFDFQYDKQPLLPLATIDTLGMVIYVSSFGKSLAPGFRTGFVVAPKNLMLEMRKYLGLLDRQGDVLMEQALGEMIEEGAIQRHLKRSVKIYRERRDLMDALLRKQMGSIANAALPDGGLAFWLVFRKKLNLARLKRLCEDGGLFIPRTLLYQHQNLCAMRLGFGHLNEEEMKNSMKIFQDAASRSTRG